MDEMNINQIQSNLPPPEKIPIATDIIRTSEGLKPETKTETLTQGELNSSDITNMVASVNEYVKVFSTKVSFGYDFENERQVILVKDSETGEIIRQIPPKEMVNLLKQLEEISGIIFHNKI